MTRIIKYNMLDSAKSISTSIFTSISKRKYDDYIKETDIEYISQLSELNQDSVHEKILHGLKDATKNNVSISLYNNIFSIYCTAFENNKKRKWSEFQYNVLEEIYKCLENIKENNDFFNNLL